MMRKRIWKKAARSALPAAFLAGCFLLLLCSVPHVGEWIAEGGRIAFFKVLPATFPYLILTTLVCRSGMARRIGAFFGRPFARLFALPPACASAVLLGLLSGFPLGAKCAAELYNEGLCRKEDAERLLAFCNFCSPPFILSAVGQGIFGSAAVGWLIYIVQSVFSLLFGIFYLRPKKFVPRLPAPPIRRERLSSALFTEAVADAGLQSLRIAAFVLCFSIPVGALRGLLTSRPQLSRFLPLLAGVLEISSGVASIEGHGLPALAASCLVVGFSGLSVMMQARSFTGEAGLSMRGYLWAHLLCPPATAAVCCLLSFALGLI